MKIYAAYLKRAFMLDYEMSFKFTFRWMYWLQEPTLKDDVKIFLKKEGTIDEYRIVIMLHKYKCNLLLNLMQK